MRRLPFGAARTTAVVRIATLSIVLTSTLAASAVALGAGDPTTPAAGAIHVFAKPGNGVKGPIVITGAIGDYGTTITIDKNGKSDANGNYVKIILKKGTFEINSTALNAKTNKAQPTVDKATCSFLFTGTGPVTLFNGTGLYKGISGTVEITIAFAGIGPLIKTGKHAGECNMSNSARLLAQYGSITGPGTVRFG